MLKHFGCDILKWSCQKFPVSLIWYFQIENENVWIAVKYAALLVKNREISRCLSVWYWLTVLYSVTLISGVRAAHAENLHGGLYRIR